MKMYFILALALIGLSSPQLHGMIKELSKTKEAAIAIKALEALKAGDLEALKKCTKNKRFSINHTYKDEDGRTLLSCLCKSKPEKMDDEAYINTLELILNHPNIDVSIPDSRGYLAIHFAACNPDTIALRWLMLNKESARINLNARQEPYGWTALNVAVSKGLIETVKVLLADKEVDPNMPSVFAEFPLHQAGIYPRQLTIIRDLVEAGAHIECLCSEITPLGAAFIPYSYDRAIALLALGASIENYQIEFNTLLTKIKLAPHDDTRDGRAILNASFEAAVKGTILPPSVPLSKITINNQDMTFGMTPLMWAAARGNLPLAEQLIAHGADGSLVDIYGDTALHYAVRSGHVHMIALLLRIAPGTFTIKNKNGRTPGDIAIAADKSLAILKALKPQ